MYPASQLELTDLADYMLLATVCYLNYSIEHWVKVGKTYAQVRSKKKHNGKYNTYI